MEFVDIDGSQDVNCPAIAKQQVLRTWSSPITVHDIASLIGFAIFYSSCTPNFKVHAKKFHEIIKLVYSEPVAPHVDDAAKAEW